MSGFSKFRAKLAERISPSQPLSNPRISRFVRVKFFAPGLPPIVETYDTTRVNHMMAWRENQRLYPSQVIAQSAEAEGFLE